MIRVEIHPRPWESSIIVTDRTNETLLHLSVPTVLGVPYLAVSSDIPEDLWPFPLPGLVSEGQAWKVSVWKGSVESVQIKSRIPAELEIELHGRDLLGAGFYVGRDWSMALSLGRWEEPRRWARNPLALARKVSDRLRTFFELLEPQVWGYPPEDSEYQEKVTEIWRRVKAGEADPALAWDRVPVPFPFLLRVEKWPGKAWSLRFEPVLDCCRKKLRGGREDWDHIMSLSHLGNFFGQDWVEERRAELPLLSGGGWGL